MEKDPVSAHEVVITDKGTSLCYDGVFGRYFISDMDTIKRAVNKINREIVSSMYVSLNEFYAELGLKPVAIGEDLGWNFDDREVEIFTSAQIAEDGRPCIVIEYSIAPHYEYNKLF